MQEPFLSYIDFASGILENSDNKLERRLSDMKNMYLDEAAYETQIAEENSLVYEVYEKHVPEESGQLAHAVTMIHPGKVGSEYFMTKGHFHVKEPTAELYLGISGKGAILMQTIEAKSEYLEMKEGSLVYVAPYWAHRTINLGDEPFSFLAIYPAEAGHNYGSIEEIGFPKLVVEENNEPKLIDNPRFELGIG